MCVFNLGQMRRDLTPLAIWEGTWILLTGSEWKFLKESLELNYAAGYQCPPPRHLLKMQYPLHYRAVFREVWRWVGGDIFITECGKGRIPSIILNAQSSHTAFNLLPDQFSFSEVGRPSPRMVKAIFPMYSRSRVCCRLYRYLQWEYCIGNPSYLKLAFRKKNELAIPAISQEFLGPLGWTAEPCGEQLSKHTWCETLTKHEEEIRAMGRSTEKAHITAIHMSLTPSPNLRASAMVSAQEKGEDRLTLQCSCKGSRHNAGGVKLLLCGVQGRCVAKTD